MPKDSKNILSSKPLEDERELENTLRPSRLSEFIGQKKLKEKLGIFIEAAKGRGEPLDHTLFYGPPGTGKTTLAHIIANEMGSNIVVTSGPALERPGDLVGILTNLSSGDVVFIDEIHRLNRVVEEYLYPAMEDMKLDIVIDQGPAARTVQLGLEHFTLIGSTTRAGLITAPLRSRFGIVERINYYPADELLEIVLRSSRILGVEITEAGAEEIAHRGRGTPRIANRILRRIRDFAQVKADGVITPAIASEALTLLDIDDYGLDEMDKRILSTIIKKFAGGPVGIKTIAAALGEDAGTIEELYEPFLIQEGFLDRTPKGRVATPLAFRHLGFKPKSAGPLFEESR